MSTISLLANGSYLGAVTLKTLTTGTIYGLIYKYFHEHSWKDPALLKAVLASLSSAGIAELVMSSILRKLVELVNQNRNAGMKRIFDQGLNAAVSGGLNIKFYELFVKKAANLEGSKWMNHEEFFAQMIADVAGEILSYHYLVPLFGLNQSHISTIYG